MLQILIWFVMIAFIVSRVIGRQGTGKKSFHKNLQKNYKEIYNEIDRKADKKTDKEADKESGTEAKKKNRRKNGEESIGTASQKYSGWGRGHQAAQSAQAAREFTSQRKSQQSLQQAELKRRLQQRYGRAPEAPVTKNSRREQDILARASANAAEDFGKNTYPGEEEDRRHKVSDLPDDCDLMHKVQDLMIMGYQGSLQFERDFIGEAQDKINSFMKY